MRVHVVFIGLGLIFLVIGMAFGMWMGINQDFQYAAAHAHWNLVGFVTSAIYGLTHRAYPKLADFDPILGVVLYELLVGSLPFDKGVITSYSIHYTKLYENAYGRYDGPGGECGGGWRAHLRHLSATPRPQRIRGERRGAGDLPEDRSYNFV